MEGETPPLVVYDTILSAIHNRALCEAFDTIVVYDTILSAIHNIPHEDIKHDEVVYDTILSAMSKNVCAKDKHCDCKNREKKRL